MTEISLRREQTPVESICRARINQLIDQHLHIWRCTAGYVWHRSGERKLRNSPRAYHAAVLCARARQGLTFQQTQILLNRKETGRIAERQMHHRGG